MADQVKHASKAMDRLRQSILKQMEDESINTLNTQMRIWDAFEKIICKRFNVSADEVNLYEIKSDQTQDDIKTACLTDMRVQNFPKSEEK